ncbi:MAG: LytTR family DNA-binding domain-containing protein [Bacteroidota bacterium]
MDQLAFTTGLSKHLLIGLLQGMWVYLFLVIIGPFDTYDLSFWWRAELMLGYWLFFAAAYWLAIPVQNWLYLRLKRWTWSLELLLVILVYLIAFPLIFSYYKSDIVEGEYTLVGFGLGVYLPSSLILLPVMLAVRRFIMRNESAPTHTTHSPDKVVLRGKYQKDILHIHWADLICIKSAGNYVEVYYLQTGQIEKKLLRTSTQKMEGDLPALVRTHRSYLINPSHFIAWKGRKQLIVSKLEVPVSENYRPLIEERFLVRP